MSEEQKAFIYKVEDIFEDIPDDPKNMNMTIPPEIMEKVGLKEGDTIKISYGDQGTIIFEKVDKKETNEKEETGD
jgi:formylmethanofuran dehydrogenase subunit D|tara:strand:+ start:3290 stop:3514 length:225 start_codon:yes stop_codon:yes gene_type:complete